jgi:hypothetical protein
MSQSTLQVLELKSKPYFVVFSQVDRLPSHYPRLPSGSYTNDLHQTLYYLNDTNSQ